MHEPYKRIAEKPDKAILFIHGILGTPDHFRQLVALVPEEISVCNVLLDGHGKGVKGFAATSMKKWEAQIADAVSDLAQTHREICIVGHSMGTLLAIGQAVQCQKVTKLFLLAVPLRLFLKPKMPVNSLRVYLNRIDPENPEHLAAKACYSITDSKNVLLYLLWVPRFLELLGKMRRTRNILAQVKVPCFAFQSARDEMVSSRSGSLLQKNPAFSVTQLPNSSHYYYTPQDLSLLEKHFPEFIS